MKVLLAGLLACVVAGCASLTGGSGGAQPVNVIMGVLASASVFAANGCIPPTALSDPVLACAPTTSTDQTAINAALQACLTATVTQLVTRNLPKCQTVPMLFVPPK